MNNERQEMEKWIGQMFAAREYQWSVPIVADFVEAQVLRTLRECTKLVCPHCANGDSPENGRHMYFIKITGSSCPLSCPAAPIHAKIAQLSGKESQ